MNPEEMISANEAARRLNTTLHIVRSFCDHGYITGVRRGRQYRRLLSLEQFELLSLLVSMKQSGFSKPEIKRYARLARQGDATAAERLAILTTRKHQLQQEILERQKAISFIERQEELAV